MAEHLLARGTVAENHREAFAGRGAVAELLAGSAMAKRMVALWRRAIGKLLLARGTVAECYREPFAGQGAAAELYREAATAGKGRYCWKGEQLPEIRTTAGKENHCQKGKVGVRLPARRDCSGATGWSLFLMRPLCKLFLYL